MFSTITTEASTIMPKSIAPIEIRFADSPRITIMTNVLPALVGAESIPPQRAPHDGAGRSRSHQADLLFVCNHRGCFPAAIYDDGRRRKSLRTNGADVRICTHGSASVGTDIFSRNGIDSSQTSVRGA